MVHEALGVSRARRARILQRFGSLVVYVARTPVVENCDPLAISRGDSFEITPFGEAYRLFLERYRGKTPPYSHSDVQCEIAVIHADDGVFSANGTFDGAGSYGFS